MLGKQTKLQLFARKRILARLDWQQSIQAMQTLTFILQVRRVKRA